MIIDRTLWLVLKSNSPFATVFFVLFCFFCFLSFDVSYFQLQVPDNSPLLVPSIRSHILFRGLGYFLYLHTAPPPVIPGGV